MKILHVINDLGSGGAEKLIVDILPRMKNEGHDVEVLLLNGTNSLDNYLEKLSKHDIEVNTMGNYYLNPFYLFRMIPILRKGNFDIVHVHLFPSLYYVSLSSFFLPKKTKLFYTEHSVSNDRRNYISLKCVERFLYRRYDRVICITQLVKKSLDAWLHHTFDKSIIINNGVNLDEISSAQLDIDKKEYDFLKKDKKNILMVGRFNLSLKNQLSLVNALALLGDEYHLYFAGVGDDMIKVEDLGQKLNISNQVFFLGLRTDVYKLMHLVDLNVLSTHQEGLSGVTLEGLASGKPFLGSDVGGVNDVVPNARFLFPDNDPEALAKRIKEVLSDKNEAEYLVAEGTQFVQQFSIDKMVKAYLKEYEAIM